MRNLRVRWKLHLLAVLVTCFVFVMKSFYDGKSVNENEKGASRSEK